MLTEDQGVKAIQDLLKLAGQSEPEEQSRQNWINFKDWEKRQTETAHSMFCGGFPPEDEPG